MSSTVSEGDKMSSEQEEKIVERAKEYLEVFYFSENDLKEQLEFEGFQSDDVSDALAKLSVDWRQQALSAAKEYLDRNPVTMKGELFNLLTLAKGFTDEDAQYAVDSIF